MKLKMKMPEPLESEIQSAVCQYLEMRGHFFWRQNSAGIQRTGKDGRQFWATNKYSIKGVGDIICFDKTGTGIAIFLEIKRPSGKMSEEQKEFQRRCELVGCEYYVIRRIEDLQEVGL